MDQPLDVKRIGIFLTFAFGIAWYVGLVVYLSGGIVNSPTLIPGTQTTLALVLIAVGYMWAPGLAHILTRWVTGEGWQGMHLAPRFKSGWGYWLAAWVLPALLTLAGAAIFFILFPRYFDPSLGVIRSMLPAGQELPFSPLVIILLQLLQAILISPLVNSLFTLGEELGWRAYLLPKLMPLGGRKAMLIMGVIWGVWHWPVIAMGHNYGLNYAGAPWLGMLAMVWFTLVIGIFLGWASLRGGSVWPAVIGHAAINGIAGIGALMVQGQPNPLLGPLPTGLVASAAWSALALGLFLSPKALRPEPEEGEGLTPA